MRRFLRVLGLTLLYVCLAALAIGVCAVDAVPDDKQTVFLLGLLALMAGAVAGGWIAVGAE